MRPSATVGPAASCATTSPATWRRPPRPGPRGGRCPSRGLRRPTSSRPRSSSSRARATPTRRGSSHVAPLSGVKPRAANGSQNRASSAATVKSAASASWSPMPGGPAPHARTRPAPAPRASAGSAGGPATAAGAGCCRRAGARVAGRRVAGRRCRTPPQKWSPAPASTIAAHRLVAPGGVDRRRSAPPPSRRRSRCASSGRSSVEAQHARRRATIAARRRRTSVPALVRSLPSANRAAMASSAPCRSVAPPGGSGRRTGPCSRLGSRIVAWPGVVTSPRWFSAPARGRPPAGRRRRGSWRVTRARAATGCRRRS